MFVPSPPAGSYSNGTGRIAVTATIAHGPETGLSFRGLCPGTSQTGRSEGSRARIAFGGLVAAHHVEPSSSPRPERRVLHPHFVLSAGHLETGSVGGGISARRRLGTDSMLTDCGGGHRLLASRRPCTPSAVNSSPLTPSWLRISVVKASSRSTSFGSGHRWQAGRLSADSMGSPRVPRSGPVGRSRGPRRSDPLVPSTTDEEVKGRDSAFGTDPGEDGSR